MEKLINKIIEWGGQRELLSYSCHPKQLIKAYEEFGEISRAYLKGDREELIDGCGDLLVVLILFAHQLKLVIPKYEPINIIKSTNGMDSKLRKVSIELGWVSSCVDIESKYYAQSSFNSLWKSVIRLCSSNSLNPIHCLESAYNVIKNRKGNTVNGTFIKESA